jgi:hypothetical protein
LAQCIVLGVGTISNTMLVIVGPAEVAASGQIGEC